MHGGRPLQGRALKGVAQWRVPSIIRSLDLVQGLSLVGLSRTLRAQSAG